MSPDCEHPACHEKMKLALKGKAEKECINKMLPKKSIWAAIPILIALGVMAIGAADFKYAQNSDVEEIKRQHERFKSDQIYIKKDIKEIKDSQKATAQDIKKIKEILMNR